MNSSSKVSSLLTLGLLVFVVFACNVGGTKTRDSAAIAVPEDKKDYIGDWEGKFQNGAMTLRISTDGTVNYERKEEGSKTGIFSTTDSKYISNGNIVRFEGDDFVVKASMASTTFKVEKPPYRDGKRWKMVVDGVELGREHEGSDELTINIAEMRKDDGNGKMSEEVSDTFTQSDRHIHTVINWDNPRLGTKVKFVYTVVDAGETEGEVLTESTVVTENESDDQVHDRLNMKKPLPKGSYKLDIYINDKLERTLPFKVV